MERPRILLTGFGPFPGVPTNPSAWLAETLAEGLPAPDLHGRIHVRIFPTEWQAAGLVADLCETLQPHVMIHFGVSEHAKTFRLLRHLAWRDERNLLHGAKGSALSWHKQRR